MTMTLVTCLLSLSAATAGAGTEPDPVPRPAAPPSWPHTRPLSPGISALLEEAREKSSIVAGLINELEKTDVVVYITDSLPSNLRAPTSYLVFLTRDAGTRYLLVRISQWRVSSRERIALLGHELQHALEVAAAGGVQDGAGLADLYGRIGWPGGRNQFESKAAQTTAYRIRKELARR